MNVVCVLTCLTLKSASKNTTESGEWVKVLHRSHDILHSAECSFHPNILYS
jgi:hypothetical protein